MVRLYYIYLEDGEFLYDPMTRSVYTFDSPHLHMGYLNDDGKLVMREKRKLKTRIGSIEKICAVNKQ